MKKALLFAAFTLFVSSTQAQQVINLDDVRSDLGDVIVKSKKAKAKWSIKPTHLSVRDVIEDWAANVGYEVIWEHRNFVFENPQKSEKLISTGTFWDALTLLGESYRNSDSPFQIQPTKFKQIVVQPMQSIDVQFPGQE